MNLENGMPGSRFPTLILHKDCDGRWTPDEAASLERELEIISGCFQELPPISLSEAWKKEVARSLGIRMASLYDCFFDVDGEPLLERMIGLAKLSQTKDLPIILSRKRRAGSSYLKPEP